MNDNLNQNNSGKIINADDDPVIRDIVQAILQAEGYEVVSVPDGEAVFDRLEDIDDTSDIKCFILDIEMPKMNGLEALIKLKSDPDTSDIPVILLTAQSESSDFVKTYEFDAEHYILKPFTRQELLEGLSKVI